MDHLFTYWIIYLWINYLPLYNNFFKDISNPPLSLFYYVKEFLCLLPGLFSSFNLSTKYRTIFSRLDLFVKYLSTA